MATGASSPSLGGTIMWGSEFNDVLLDSRTADLDFRFSFEIGMFTPGFTPDLSNLASWAGQWQVFDAVVTDDGWSPLDHAFMGGADHNGNSDSPDADPADVFPAGQQIYLWAFNSKNLNSQPEWALLTDLNTSGNLYSPWVFPAESSTDTFTLRTVDLDTAILGGVNGSQSPGGDYTAPGGGFTLQTHVVPEPSSMALAVLAAALLCPRRRQGEQCGSF